MVPVAFQPSPMGERTPLTIPATWPGKFQKPLSILELLPYSTQIVRPLGLVQPHAGIRLCQSPKDHSAQPRRKDCPQKSFDHQVVSLFKCQMGHKGLISCQGRTVELFCKPLSCAPSPGLAVIFLSLLQSSSGHMDLEKDARRQ